MTDRIDRRDTRHLPLALALGACALAAVTTVQAHGDRGSVRLGKRLNTDPAATMERLDKDGDGVLTPADVPEGERADRMLKRLERVDADGDGQVTLEELERAQAEARERVDRDGDGILARRELRRDRSVQKLKARDADGDGRLSLEEFSDRTEGFARLDRDGDGALQRRDLAAGLRAAQLLKHFDSLDADHDGELTAPEVEAARAARFARFDADDDGFLTTDELQATRRQRGGGRKL